MLTYVHTATYTYLHLHTLFEERLEVVSRFGYHSRRSCSIEAPIILVLLKVGVKFPSPVSRTVY